MEKGLSLDKALEKCGAFPHYMTAMLGIGLVSGRAAEVCLSLAEHYRREHEIEQSVRHRLMAPAGLALTIAAVFLILIAKALPVFQRSFALFGLALSPAASALLGFGRFSRIIAAVLALLLALGAMVLLWMDKTAPGRAFAAKLYTLWLSRSASGIDCQRSRAAGALELMLKSGLAPAEAVERAGRLLGNCPIGEKLSDCLKAMDELGFAPALESSGVFSPMDSALISAAFRAGQAEEALSDLSDRCAGRAQACMARAMDRSEMIMVCALCAAVGSILLSVMLPLLGAMAGMGGI